MNFDRKRQLIFKSRLFPRDHPQGPYFLHDEVEAILLDRLSYVRPKFSRVLLTGVVSQNFVKGLLALDHGKDILVQLVPCVLPFYSTHNNQEVSLYKVVGDEESLPFSPGSFDLIISCLTLHQLNKVFETLRGSYTLLRADGLYLAAFWGGETLHELRQSFLRAEIEITGGAALRVHPMIKPEDATALFNRSGFKSAVIDYEKFTIIYPCLNPLLKEIKKMGEGNSVAQELPKYLSRSILKRAEEIYRQLFGDQQGDLTATVEAIFLSGWA